MRNFVRVITLLCLTTCVSLSEVKSRQFPHALIASPHEQTKQAITRTVESYVSQHSSDVGAVDITQFDIQGTWALVEIAPRNKSTDTAQVLLRKQRSGWKVLVLGTALYGTGKTYGVPGQLRKKWKI